MKLLITGSNGLVGSHFTENYNGDLTIIAPSKKELDITDGKSIGNFFKLYKPDFIVHFAAFTDVSKAEDQRNNKKGLCWIVNVVGTANLIRSTSYQPYFIYISTDVVFSGLKNDPGPYDEGREPEENPDLLSWYGWTKKEAEKLVTRNFRNSAILRIANPVRLAYKPKLDYVRKILYLYDRNKLYPMFDDQYLTLTYINEITETLNLLLRQRMPGIYHVSSVNVFTPYKLANLLIEIARGRKGFVKRISIESFLGVEPTRYPQFGGLRVKKTQSKLNLRFKKWEEVISLLAKELSA